MEYASSPHDFKLMLASSGRRASDINQIFDEQPPADEEEGDGPAEGDPPAGPGGVKRPPQDPDAVELGEVGLVSGAAVAPAEPGAEERMDYGSPEHAYGRSLEADEPEPDGIGAEETARRGHADEYGAGDNGDNGDNGGSEGPEGLGAAEYAEIWERGPEGPDRG
jgi:hypothetical protein